jgi:hypothetical protein
MNTSKVNKVNSLLKLYEIMSLTKCQQCYGIGHQESKQKQ